MAYALVQSRMSVVTSSDSQGLSFTSTPSVGNLILVKASTYNGALGTSAVSDNQTGNNYGRDKVISMSSGSDVAVFSCVVANASGTFTITVNPTGSSADLSFVIEEWAGNAASPVDVSNGDSQSGTSVSSLSITPSENNCMWAGAMSHATTDTSITETNGTLVQENEGGSSNMPISATRKIQTTATSEAATWTIGASATWAAVIVAYKAAASSGVTVSLSAASISAAGQALSVVPGAVSTSLNAAAITGTGQTAAITVPAHTFDTSARIPSSGTSASNPVTGSYTCGAGATILVVMLKYANSTDRTGGAPTYNSIALTQADQVRKAATSPEGCAELWYLLNPPTGSSYTISVPNSNTKTMVVYVASAKACPGYASALDVAGGNTGTSTNPTASVTTTVVGDILFAIVFNGATTWAPSGRTGTQLYDSDDGAWGGGSQYLIKTDTGSQAMAWTFGTSDDWGECVAAFKQIAPIVTLLSAAAISASGQSLTVQVTDPGVQVSLSAASISAAGQTFTVVPGAISTTVNAASLAAAGQALSVVPGVVTTALAAGSLSASGQALTVVPGAKSTALNAANLAAAGQALSIVPGATSTSLTAAAIAAVGQSITIDAPPAGAVTVSLAAAVLTAGGQILTVVPGAISSSLNAASLTASGQGIGVSPGAVSISLAAASLTAAGQSISISAPAPGAITVSLSAAVLTASGQTLTVVPGAKSTVLNAAGISAAGQAITITPGAVSTSLAAAALSVAGRSISIIPGAVSISLNAASLTAAGQSLLVVNILYSITPDWRVFTVQADLRTFRVEREDRVLDVPAENRVIEIAREDRTLEVEAENRTYLIEKD